MGLIGWEIRKVESRNEEGAGAGSAELKLSRVGQVFIMNRCIVSARFCQGDLMVGACV